MGKDAREGLKSNRMCVAHPIAFNLYLLLPQANIFRTYVKRYCCMRTDFFNANYWGTP